MKSNRDHLTYLEDMYSATVKGISFIDGMTFEQFVEDEKTQFALIRAIEIIGEASKKIPVEIRNQSREIPWTEISGMRDVLIHDYFGINISVVWKTAKNDLSILLDQLKLLLNDLKLQ